tara:strand:+ start:1103 stop:1447 length:345 start_codon:yes stop_codon:yes gene_type:complete
MDYLSRLTLAIGATLVLGCGPDEEQPIPATCDSVVNLMYQNCKNFDPHKSADIALARCEEQFPGDAAAESDRFQDYALCIADVCSQNFNSPRTYNELAICEQKNIGLPDSNLYP